jgi:PIN domain nuclease of toxin-antitoxin system
VNLRHPFTWKYPEMCAEGEEPIKSADLWEIIKNNEPEPFAERCPEDIEKVILGLLHKDPVKRLTIREALD